MMRRRIALMGILVVVLFMGQAPQAEAQYDSDTPKLKYREASRLVGAVRSALRDPAAFQNAETRGKFDSYFQDYLFPTMTASPSQLGKLRQRFFRAAYWATGHDAVHKHLTDMTFAAMKRIATGNFHPAARYNAMLIIGRLDQQRGSDTGEKRPPVPLPETVDFLLEQLNSDVTNTPDVIVIGSIVGLARHLRYGLPDQQRDVVFESLLKVASSDRPRNRTREGHGWICAMAAETIISGGKELDEAKVQEAFVKILRDDANSVSNRTRVALATGNLEEAITENQEVDTTAFAAALSHLAVEVFEYEEKEAKKFVEGFLRGGMLGPDGQPLEYPRERVLYRTYAIKRGLAGIKPGLSDNVKAQVDEMTAKLDEIYTTAADKKQVDQTLTPLIERLAPEIVVLARTISGDTDEASEVTDEEDVGL